MALAKYNTKICINFNNTVQYTTTTPSFSSVSQKRIYALLYFGLNFTKKIYSRDRFEFPFKLAQICVNIHTAESVIFCISPTF